MAMLSGNIPYGKIMSTLASAYKYARPASRYMAFGAASGAIAGYSSGHSMRDAGIGALAGLGYGKIGVGGLSDAFRAATRKKGVLNLGAGMNSLRDAAAASWHWRGIGL